MYRIFIVIIIIGIIYYFTMYMIFILIIIGVIYLLYISKIKPRLPAGAKSIKALRRNYIVNFVDNKEFLKFSDIAYIDYILSMKKPSEQMNYIVIQSIKYTLLKKYLYEKCYIKPLLLKEKQLIYTDAYGDLIDEDFIKEVKQFINRKKNLINEFVTENMPEYFVRLIINGFVGQSTKRNLIDPDYEAIDIENTVKYIITDILPKHKDNTNAKFYNNPYEYEHYIADCFASCGWQISTTKKSGDQGADVIAIKNHYHAVIQCKLYSSPVGNNAVQEVISAKGFYNANLAIVVTNNGFSKSARQLASVHQVHLLNDSGILEFDKHIAT